MSGPSRNQSCFPSSPDVSRHEVEEDEEETKNIILLMSDPDGNS